MEKFDLIIVGGGAAGFYAAVHAAPFKRRTLIFEKSRKVLSKVGVSGGGRCNVTHHQSDTRQLARHYPRGEKALKQIFARYGVTETIKWFESHGVRLKTEDDGRMFPTTDTSQTVIDCLMGEALKHQVRLELGTAVTTAEKTEDGFIVTTSTGQVYFSTNLLITIGGSPSRRAYDWIEHFGHKIVNPVPSLFTFNDSEKKFADLMGVAVEGAHVRISGTKFSQRGPVLITHWGLSGPAVIKLSAWAAEYLQGVNYIFTASINWLGTVTEEEIKKMLGELKHTKPKQRVSSNAQFELPQRLWQRLCELAGIGPPKIWSELPQKNINRLMEFLIRCPFQIRGKTTFKEEFVTCGGVDLSEINLETMESKILPGLFFAGEVLNLDGETGGFNFQAAWSTAYVAAQTIAGR